MKKIIIALAAPVLCVGLGSGAVFADSISNTGAGSFNSIINDQTKEITVTCNDSTDVINDNGQVSSSGTTTVDGNSYSGSATSGNSTNLNSFVTNLGVSCVPVQQASTPAPTGGQGGGTPTTTTTPVVLGKTTSLPNTGSSSLAIGSVAALGLGAATWYAVRRKILSE